MLSPFFMGVFGTFRHMKNAQLLPPIGPVANDTATFAGFWTLGEKFHLQGEIFCSPMDQGWAPGDWMHPNMGIF